MRKMAYFCDVCGKEKQESLLQRFEVDEKVCDMCPVCITLVVRKVIKDSLINLRPWCKQCKGNGVVEASEYGYDRIRRSNKECDGCAI